MCFGDQKTGEKTTTSTANPAVSSAATSNLDFVQNLQNAGFQGYTGQQVADIDPAQQATIDKTQQIANNGTGDQAASMIGGYASAPAQNVQAQTISQNMSPYMNQYVMQALAPQLHQQDLTLAKNRNATDATATGSGAFGDARTGIEQSNNNFNDSIAREGLIGNAYNSAFNTAIGAGAQDTANNLSAQNANAGYNETALQRMLGGAGALQNLQTQQQGVQSTANTAAQQDTAHQQANLTAQYNQWLMAQQYPFQTAGLMNQTVAAGAGAMPATTTATETKPDNSGWAALGTAASALPFVFSDERLKEDIEHVGELRDGTPVFSYSMIGDPAGRKQIGLLAQDIKKRRPDAVLTLPDAMGTMMVDYGKATELSRSMAI